MYKKGRKQDEVRKKKKKGELERKKEGKTFRKYKRVISL